MYWLLGGVALLALALSWTSFASRLTDFVLRQIHPIPREKGLPALPSVPFKWPNGQGTEKFFEGVASAKRWRNQYGSMYRIWSGWKPEIVLTQPNQVDQFYRDSHKHVKAKNNNSGWLFGEVLGQCVGLLSLQPWRNLRKYVEEPFSRPSALKYAKDITLQAQEFLRNLGIGSSKGINPAVDLQFFPFLVVANILFGRLSAEQREKLLELAPLREELFKEVIKGGVNRLWIAQYTPGSGVGLLRRFQEIWETFVAEAYQRALVHAPNAPIVVLWQGMLEGAISKQEVLQTLDESLYANLDVTTSAIAWNVILLAQNPEQQALVRAEVMENVDFPESYINKQDTLLAAAVVEAARLRPILAFSNPESAIEDKIVDGYLIKRGTNVIIDSMAMNVENPFWKDGSQYIPSRHMHLKPAEARRNMWRFGPGPRVCLGKHVAERMLRGMLLELLSRYELSVPEHEGRTALQEQSWVGLPDIQVTCTAIGPQQ